MDSGNKMMKYRSSLPYGKGRFFLLFLLFSGFHMMQAVCRPQEAYAQAEPGNAVKIVISEGTSVSGIESLHIAPAEAKENISLPKKTKKIPVVNKLHSKKAVHKIPETRQLPKPVYNFSNHPGSDIDLYDSVLKVNAFGNSSYSFKCIMANEMKIMVALFFMAAAFLIGFYKSRAFSGCYFSQNFQRPPPSALIL